MMLLLLACIGGAFWLMYEYAGPFKWLAELQLKWFGVYEESVTLLLTALVLLTPVGIVVWLIRRTMRFAMPPIEQSQITQSNEPPITPSPAARVFSNLGIGAIFILIGLLVLGLSAYQYVRGRGASELSKLTIDDLEAGRVPASRWCSIKGFPVFKLSGAYKSSTSAAQDYYVPVISSNWPLNGPATLYLKVRERELTDDIRFDRAEFFQGMLTPRDLPGLVRTQFEREGPRPAANYYVLELGKTPADLLRIARDLLILGGGMTVAGVIILVAQRMEFRWRGRRTAVATVSSGPDPRFQIKAIKTLSPPASQSPPDPPS
jgi:hypothetical protein